MVRDTGPAGFEPGELVERLRHVLWIGGGTGAGKTSIAAALAKERGLQSYHYDFHDARDHSERIDPSRHPTMHAFAAMSMDQRWVFRTPEEMANETITSSRERMEMAIQDLLARPSSLPIVAEGAWFFPELVAPLLTSARQAIWLVPTVTFRERALRERGWVTIEGTRDGDRARANRLARDAWLTEHVRRSAEMLGQRVFEIDGAQSLAEVTAIVVEQFAPVLHAFAGIATSDPVTDATLRRELVGSFMPFVARCTRGHAVLERVARRNQLEAHQLGLLNAAYLAGGRGPVTEGGLRDAVPYSTRSRVGADHWRPLIAAGLARAQAGGWILTDAGHDAIAELYREIWEEVARRSVDPALAGRVGEILERLSHVVPLTSRARFIRDAWGDAPAPTLVRLYRAVWELSIYRDVCFRAAWEAEGYTGPSIDVLTQIWEGATTVEEVSERLALKQEVERILNNLALLDDRGDIESAGESVSVTVQGRTVRTRIENRTDAAYFNDWPSGIRLRVLMDDLDALMRAMVDESAAGVAPT